MVGYPHDVHLGGGLETAYRRRPYTSTMPLFFGTINKLPETSWMCCLRARDLLSLKRENVNISS